MITNVRIVLNYRNVITHTAEPREMVTMSMAEPLTNMYFTFTVDLNMAYGRFDNFDLVDKIHIMKLPVFIN